MTAQLLAQTEPPAVEVAPHPSGSESRAATSHEPMRRTAEIEEVTNRTLIHPLASRLTPRLASLRISPNAVSLAGMSCGLLAGVAYYHYRQPAFAAAGFLLMVMWHVLDGADGQLARLTHSQSQIGKVLDGVCDYVTFMAVYTGLALATQRQVGSWVWAIAIIAGLCHALQSAAYEAQRQDYEFWGWGKASAELLDVDAQTHDRVAATFKQRCADTLHALYVRMQLLATGTGLGSRRRLAVAMRLRPERTQSVRARYRAVFAPSVRRWSILSANYRTLGIFLFAIIKAPLGYFYFEIFGFSAILVILLSTQPARYRLFLAGLNQEIE